MKMLLSFVLLAPASFAQGHVLVVDAAGGGAYVQIGTALQNAAPGDVLLVRSGSYAGFGVANQSVAIVGDSTATVQINGTVQVRNLLAGRTVLLHRLQAFGATSGSQNDGPGITIRNDTGPVRVQDCFAQGAAGMPGVRVEGCGDVALGGTQAFGGVAWPQSGAGVLANGTAIALYGCDAQGAAGAVPAGSQPPYCNGGHGGCALLSSMVGFILVAGSQLLGGQGYNGADGCQAYGINDCCYGGNGGSGIDVLTGAHTLWQLANSDQPGTGGIGGTGYCGCGLQVSCQCDPGHLGLDVAHDSGDTLVSLSGACPTLGLNANPARELTTLGITIDSAPGDEVLLVFSQAVDFAPEQNRGVRLVDWNGAHSTLRLGATNSQGHLSFPLPIPDLGAGVQSRIVHVQALVVHASGSRVWSNPVSLVLLDSAF